MGIDWISRSQAIAPSVRNFIDGRWRIIRGDSEIEKYGSRDGRHLCRFGVGHIEDVNDAVLAARIAYTEGRWSRIPVQARKDVLYRFAALIESHREELALLECLDVGKPITDATTFDVPSAVSNIKYYAEAADKWHGKVYGVDHTSLSYQLYRPLGVVAGIVGWNFPLVLAASKIAPVLATGNSLVLKPSEITSLSTARIAELAVEAGVPPGVLNVIHGNGEVGDALARHRDVDAVTFTGSSQTGRRLLIAAGQSNMKRVVLECGGKAPNIVFDDSPRVDGVVNAILSRAFWNQGQVCTASSRLLVQRGIKDELLSLLVQKAASMKVGDPLVSDTSYGAVVSEVHQRKILGYIESGEREGSKLIFRSSAPAPFPSGFYVPFVILDKVKSSNRIAQEEIFGPVLSVIEFADENEAIRIANDTIYGLSATIWTKDIGRAHRTTQGIQAGWITVNTTGSPEGGPADGVLSIGGHKQSGIGSEGGSEGLEAYTSKTAVQIFV